MSYGHGDLLASLGRCEAVPYCPKPANGMKIEDGRRLCPEHALEELVAEEEQRLQPELVFCRPPLLVAPCSTNGLCWGHAGCVGFADCPCVAHRNTRLQEHGQREAADSEPGATPPTPTPRASNA